MGWLLSLTFHFLYQKPEYYENASSSENKNRYMVSDNMHSHADQLHASLDFKQDECYLESSCPSKRSEQDLESLSISKKQYDSKQICSNIDKHEASADTALSSVNIVDHAVSQRETDDHVALRNESANSVFERMQHFENLSQSHSMSASSTSSNSRENHKLNS